MDTKQLKKELIDANISVNDFCKKVGISYSLYNRVMNGKSLFDVAQASKIKKVLNLSNEKTIQIFL